MPRLFSYLRCLISLFVLFLLPGSCSCRKLIESWLLINMIYFCVYLRFVTLTWKFSPPPGASSKEKSVFFFFGETDLKKENVCRISRHRVHAACYYSEGWGGIQIFSFF